MIIDFRMQASKLLAAVRRRQQAYPTCAGGPVEFLGAQYVLDHVEPLDELTLENVPSGLDLAGFEPSWVRVRQLVKLFIVKVADLEPSGESPTPAETELTISVAYDLQIHGTSKLGYRLCSVFHSADLGPLAQTVPLDEATIAQAFPPEVCSPLDLHPIRQILRLAPQEELELGHLGILVDPVNSAFLAIRIQVGKFDGTWWKEFYTSGGPNHLLDDDWSVYVDHRLLTPTVRKLFAEALAKSSDFSLDSGPSATWLASGTSARIRVDFSGEVIDACECLWSKIDVDVDVDVDVTISVKQPDVLTTEITVDWDEDNLEVLCCELTAALFWPAVGAILLDEGKINWGQYLGGLAITPVGVFIAAVIAAGNQQPNLSAPAGCTKVHNKKFRCDQPAPAFAAGFGKATLAEAGRFAGSSGSGPKADGLRLAGTLEPPTELAPAAIKVQVGKTFRWELPAKGCKSSGPMPKNFHASMSLDISNQAPWPHKPLWICHVQALDDPLSQFSPHLKLETLSNYPNEGYRLRCQIPDWAIKPAYKADPYPLKVLIVTTGGARLITVPGPQELTESEKKHAEMVWVAVNQAICDKLTVPYNEFFLIELPPPPSPKGPPGFVRRHLLNVLVSGLNPGDTVALEGADGSVIAMASPSRSRAVQLTGLALDEEAGLDFRVRGTLGERSRSLGAERVQLQLDYRQALLMGEGAVALAEPTAALQLARLNGRPSVLVQGSAGTSVFDLAPAGSVRPTWLGLFPGAGAVVGWGGEILAFERFRILAFDLRSGRVRRAGRHRSGNALAARRRGGLLYVLTDQGVDIYDFELDLVGQITHRGAHSMVVTRATLALAGRSGIVLLDRRDPRAPERLSELPGDGVEAVFEVPALTAVHEALFIQETGGGGSLVHLDDAAPPEVAAHYEETPWFARAGRAGGAVVLLAEDGRSFEVLASAAVGEEVARGEEEQAD